MGIPPIATLLSVYFKFWRFPWGVRTNRWSKTWAALRNTWVDWFDPLCNSGSWRCIGSRPGRSKYWILLDEVNSQKWIGTCAGKNLLSAKSLHGFLQMFPLNPLSKKTCFDFVDFLGHGHSHWRQGLVFFAGLPVTITSHHLVSVLGCGWKVFIPFDSWIGWWTFDAKIW